MSCARRSMLVAIAGAALVSRSVPGVSAETAPAAASAQPVDPTHIGQKVSLPDGRHLRITCAGSGSPTVILEAGWDGGGSYSRQARSRRAGHT